MKLNSRYDICEFIETINSCSKDVYLRAESDEIINLKNDPSLYIGIGYLVDGNKDVEIYATCREDEAAIISFIADLDRRQKTA